MNSMSAGIDRLQPSVNGSTKTMVRAFSASETGCCKSSDRRDIIGADSHPYIEVKGGNHRWGLKDDKERHWRRYEKSKGDGPYDDYAEFIKSRPYPISYLGDRNYRLFAALADVRNHGDGVEPLFPHRGLPEDLSAATKKFMDSWAGDYHSHTYFTLEELMASNLDKPCSQLQVAMFPLQYAHWKDTGEVLPSVKEEYEVKHATRDPIHRQVTEEEMLLLLASGDPKSLTKRCERYLGHRKRERTVGGPYVATYVPVSYRQLLPGLDRLIEALKEYGPPDRVRVVLAFDN